MESHYITINALHVTVLWDVALCSFVEIGRSLKGAYSLHDQGETEISHNYYIIWAFAQTLVFTSTFRSQTYSMYVLISKLTDSMEQSCSCEANISWAR
jgi:predicted membrane protein